MSEPAVETLLTVQQAIRIIDGTPVVPRVLRVALDESAGLRLAMDVSADRDFPPFRKSLMDGYAVRSADVAGGTASLLMVGSIAAGQSAPCGIEAGQTMAIMTGAPLPPGADGVVPVEDVAERAVVGEQVQILRAATPGRYVAAQASDCAAGRQVLARGTLIGPAQIAVLASVGLVEVECFARPRVAVLGTGDEIVPANQTPANHQIRDSNTHMLAALLRRLGCEVVQVASVRDDPGAIRDAIADAMQHDALFITGGMSMGDFDFVPRVLLELGVEMKISKLKIKPGKPLVFGVGGEGLGCRLQDSGRENEQPSPVGDFRNALAPRAAAYVLNSEFVNADASTAKAETRTLNAESSRLDPEPSRQNPEPARLNPPFIFGLPGNPVSAFVCTLRLASRLLSRMAGGTVEERWIDGRLDAGLAANGPREFYQPAFRQPIHGQHSAHAEFARITPLQWKGSADLFTLAAANALIVRGENEPPLPKGTVVRVLEI